MSTKDERDDIQDSLPFLLGRMESKLDQVLETHKDHGKRITGLEKDKHKVLGAMAVISAGISAFFSWFISK